MEEGITMSREKKLDQKMLVSNINRICAELYKDFTVSELIHKGGPRHRVEIKADGLEFYVDFHFKANGSTSIDISTGHNVEQKKKIMTAILGDTSCLLVSEERISRDCL